MIGWLLYYFCQYKSKIHATNLNSVAHGICRNVLMHCSGSPLVRCVVEEECHAVLFLVSRNYPVFKMTTKFFSVSVEKTMQNKSH